MSKVKVNWSAKGSGIENVDLDEFGINAEEWNELSISEQKEIAQEYIDTLDSTLVFGIVDSFELLK